MEDAPERRAVLCILDFLRTATCPEGADPEAIGIAIDCLSTAYSVDATNDTDLLRYGVEPGLLLRLLNGGAQGQGRAPGDGEGKEEKGEKRPAVAGSGAEESRRGDGEGVGGTSKRVELGTEERGESRPAEAATETPAPTPASDDAQVDNGAASNPAVEAPEPKPSSSEEAPEPNPGVAAASGVASGAAPSAASAGSGGAVDVSAKLEEFLKGLEKANYYDGTTPGSWEYLERQRQAKKIFDQCIEQQQGEGSAAAAGSSGAAYVPEAAGSQSKGKQPVDESSSDQKSSDRKAQADRFKTEGNTAMAEKRFSDAAALYTQAIALHENDAIFWANRAAAHLQLGNFEVALSDSQEAIQRDPTYSKAYSRLGHAYMGLQKYKEAIDLGFKKALELDSNNNAIKEAMKAAKRKLDARRGEEAREQERREQHRHHQQQQQQQHGQGSSFGFSFPTGGIPGFPSQGSSGGNMVPPGFAALHQGNMQMPGVNVEYAVNDDRPGGRLLIQSTNGNPLDPNAVNSLLGMFRPPGQQHAGQQPRRPGMPY